MIIVSLNRSLAIHRISISDLGNRCSRGYDGQKQDSGTGVKRDILSGETDERDYQANPGGEYERYPPTWD
jgi:hypothetical protein